MVDQVKAREASSLANREEVRRNNSLRENFRNLSSGLKISRGTEDQAVAVNTTDSGNRNTFTRLIRGLNDAISFSALALRSLEQAASEAEAPEQDSKLVNDFIDGLGRLRNDIDNAVQTLKQRAESAEVIRENFNSATAQLEDVEHAQAHAESTGLQIQRQLTQAIDAHQGLSSSRVQALLSE